MLLYKNGRFYSKDVSFMVPDGVIAGNHNPPEAPPDQREGIPPQGIRSAGGTLSGQPEGGSGRNRPPNKAAGGYPPAEPAAQPSIEQPHVEIEAVTQAEAPNPSGPGGVWGALPKRLTPLAVGSRA